MGSIERFMEHQLISHAASLPLPLVHVTTLARFRDIWEDGFLNPQPCSILKKDVLYCSYGEVIVRPSGKQRGWAEDVPVVLLLSSAALQGTSYFAPVDTGAIASGRLTQVPDSMRSKLGDRFGVRDVGGRKLKSWIDLMYGGHEGFLHRDFAEFQHDEPEEISIVRQLCLAMNADEEELDYQVDLRVMTQIECHIARPVSLRQHLRAAYFSETSRSEAQMVKYEFGDIVRSYEDGPKKGNLPADLLDMVRSKIARTECPIGPE